MSNTNSGSNSVTRQPMCGGGKIQLPAINNSKPVKASLDVNGNFSFEANNISVSMNANIIENDLCYNRCPNGEAPQVDKMNGQYFCLVPALVTYQVKQNPRIPDGTETKVQKVDEIDYTKSYSVSCQSTDLLDYSPQIGNKENNVMYGIPVQLKSGLYESPLPPGALRNINFSTDGESKWFCKRPMYGAPALGALQSPYEAITQQIVTASTEISDDCLTHLDNGGLFGDNSNSKNIKCEPKSATTNAAIALSGGLPLINNVVDANSSSNVTQLSIVKNSNDVGVSVPDTTTYTNPNTGVVTSVVGASGHATTTGVVTSVVGASGHANPDEVSTGKYGFGVLI